MKEIKEALLKQKKELFKDYQDEIEKGKIIKATSLKDKEQEEAVEIKIRTGTVIDEVIGGGVPEGKSLMLYGEFGSGKSQTCFSMAALCPNYVVYIDTEDSFRVSRLKEICKERNLNFEEVRDRIIYYQPKNWAEQMLMARSIPSPADIDGKVDLIICDSLTKHFRGVEFLGREHLGWKTGLIREFIFEVGRIAKMHKAAFVYTTQIYEEPAVTPYSSKATTQMPLGGHSAKHQPDFILFFRKGSGNIRIVRMMDSSWNPLAERAFVINEKGVDDIPETAKAFSAEERRSKTFAKKQQQENIKPKKKKGDESDEIPA